MRQLNHTAQVAQLLRKELKSLFPDKFQVYTPHHGCIWVKWTEGTLTEEIEKITNKYESGHFDGMTDSYVYEHKNNPTVNYINTKREKVN